VATPREDSTREAAARDAAEGERWRLFIGLPPPDEARTEIARRTAFLHDLDAGARWVSPANLHVTLLFLGDRDPADVAGIVRAIEDVTRRHVPYRIELDGAGSFGGGRRGRTIWLRVGRGRTETAALAADLDTVLSDDGSDDQGADVRPHLTLARAASGDLAARARAELLAPPIGWPVEQIHLYRSRLGHGPPVYEELATVRLGTGAARA
jgi:RNA 2',3'-cyclic 3'-phosphodiesterase